MLAVLAVIVALTIVVLIVLFLIAKKRVGEDYDQEETLPDEKPDQKRVRSEHGSNSAGAREQKPDSKGGYRPRH